MKNLVLSNTGGFPFVLDDLDFMQTATREAMASLLTPFVAAGEVLILSGCERSTASGNTTITGGWIFWNGEVFQVLEHTFTTFTTGEVERWNVEEAFLPAGNKVFENTNSYDTYKERTAKVVIDTTPTDPGEVAYIQSKKYWDVVLSNLPQNDWQVIDVSVNSNSVVRLPQVHKDLSGYCSLRGEISNIVFGGTPLEIGVLPAGHRPNQTFTFVYNEIDGSSNAQSHHIKIHSSSGVIEYIDGTNAGITSFVFDQVPRFRTL